MIIVHLYKKFMEVRQKTTVVVKQ